MSQGIKLQSLLGKALYSVKYVDDDAWTVPVLLTSDRLNKFIDDLSVEKVKIMSHNGSILDPENPSIRLFELTLKG